MSVSLREINEYLFYEFGRDLEESEEAIADDYPFELTRVGDFKRSAGDTVEIFRFWDGEEEYYAYANSRLSFLAAAGMALEDLRLQESGRDWIAANDAVDLDTTRVGYAGVPPANERRTRIEDMVAGATLDEREWRVREGLFLVAQSRYLALVERDDKKALVLGAVDYPVEARFPAASPWRRLAHSLGVLIEAGELIDAA